MKAAIKANNNKIAETLSLTILQPEYFSFDRRLLSVHLSLLDCTAQVSRSRWDLKWSEVVRLNGQRTGKNPTARCSLSRINFE